MSYCDVGDHYVDEDEIVRGSEANSCVECQEKMHEDYMGRRPTANRKAGVGLTDGLFLQEVYPLSMG